MRKLWGQEGTGMQEGREQCFLTFNPQLTQNWHFQPHSFCSPTHGSSIYSNTLDFVELERKELEKKDIQYL